MTDGEEREYEVCEDCGIELDEETGCNELDNGDLVCDDCFSHYETCEECGEQVREEEICFWGDSRICRDCLEEHVPPFDRRQNERETADAYERTRQRFLGRVAEEEDGEYELHRNLGEETDQVYRLTVTVGEDGKIEEISRLTCEILVSEALTSSDWRPYPIDREDYEEIAEPLIEEFIDGEYEEDDFY